VGTARLCPFFPSYARGALLGRPELPRSAQLESDRPEFFLVAFNLFPISANFKFEYFSNYESKLSETCA
jgi:hypothetical protein